MQWRKKNIDFQPLANIWEKLDEIKNNKQQKEETAVKTIQ